MAAAVVAPTASRAGTTLTLSNNTAITINDNANASPYQSSITPSGITAALVTKVSVRLKGFTHSYPPDVDMILVGPQGQRSIIMSDAGGDTPGVSGLTLTFDQNAASAIPQFSSPSTGTYRPVNYGSDADTFPAPGPGVLTGEPADLSVFNLTDPNGAWKLYIVDDATGDTGSISGGWDLILTVPNVFTVTNTKDGGAGSLRQALIAAGDGDLINFDSSLFSTPQTITLTSGEIAISHSVTIQGPGANLLTVRRAYDASTEFRIFNINGGVADGVAISGMTISNGNPGSGIFGGAMNSNSKLTLTKVHVAGNTAQSGGGVGLAFADGVITDCTLSGNSSTNAGGNGGGISFQGDGGHTLRVVNSTISGNTAVGFGAGICNASTDAESRVEVISSTIFDNHGGASGIFTDTDGGGTATTTLRNSIVASNTPKNLATAQFDGGGAATVQTLGFNLSDNFNGVFTPDATDVTSTTPHLGPLSLNGGQTPTHAVLYGSPALDAGNASGLTTDQRGLPRPAETTGVADNSDGSDIGAVEMQSIVVFSTNDSGNGTLRKAITEANANGAALDDIIFEDSVFSTPQTINLLTALPDITSSVTIHGPAANLVTVRRDPTAQTNFRIFNIAAGATNGVAISGMTITGGRGADVGGGIFSQSNLTLTNVHVTGNTAANGGGVLMAFSDGFFTGCTFSDNTVTGNGGAIGYQGDGHTLRVTSSTITDNHADHGGGGGIAHTPVNGSSRVEIASSTVANNSALVGGGIMTVTAVDGTSATTTLRNSIIAGNTPNNLGTQTKPGNPVVVTSLGFNLASDGGGGFLNAATDKTNANAGLAPLGDNGGPTPTRGLLTTSAALDSGDSSGLITDQRGFTRVFNTPNVTNVSDGADIGATEFQGISDLSRYWTTDWDGDGNAFGIEYALGTDPLFSDRGNAGNLTAPSFNPQHQAVLTFGRNPDAAFGTMWVLSRSTDLVSWIQIYSFDGTNQTFDSAHFQGTVGASSITVIDKTPPSPKAFYRFEAVLP